MSAPPLGPYESLGLLGSGGMADVHRVRHKTLGAEFALKRMHRELAEKPEVRAMFNDELKVLAKLRHPNIVEVHDLFVAEDGAPVIVMELVAGQTLRKLMSAGLTPRTSLRLARVIAGGL